MGDSGRRRKFGRPVHHPNDAPSSIHIPHPNSGSHSASRRPTRNSICHCEPALPGRRSAREIAPSIPTPPRCLRVEPLKARLPDRVLRPSLGDGEREALALALEIQADRILLDDRIARRAADELKLVVTGTVGVLLGAKRHGLTGRAPLADP